MYTPRPFVASPDDVAQALSRSGAADLVTSGPGGLAVTVLPLVHVPERAALVGHVARANEHWRHADGCPAVAILRGPDGYVSPSWYPSKAAHGRVVPTWDYLAVHVHGTVTVHDDPAWVEDAVRRLTERHEAGRAAPWSVDDAPRAFVESQLRAIVGIELSVRRIDAKAKLSQNRPPADVDGVLCGLRADGADTLADAVEAHR
jgi:transcriptional regulator